MSYSGNLNDSYRRAAFYIDRLLRVLRNPIMATSVGSLGTTEPAKTGRCVIADRPAKLLVNTSAVSFETDFKRTSQPNRLMSAIGGKADMHARRMSAFDPKRTSARISCCSSEDGFSPYQRAHLSRYDAAS